MQSLTTEALAAEVVGRALQGAINMSRLGLGLLVGVSLLAGSPFGAVAGGSASQVPHEVPLQVPLNVSEVVSGGTWTDGTANGTFRTITLQVAALPADSGSEEHALVYLQWLGSRTPLDSVEIIQSLPISEFNELHLGSASVAIEAEREGQARITITSQDSDEKPPVTVSLTATTPGHYQIQPSVASSPQTSNRR